ncbi:MAG TPA: cell division protein FtsQ/DivIB [Thermohalobaculum sp.]|nr:cell division protein FtsQ/DivIB [Thermohalobaculum sp.]
MREVAPKITADQVRRSAHPALRPASPVGRQPVVKKGPGPSKLSYRLSRAWAKPMLRNAVLVYLPLVALALVGWRVVANDEWRGMIEAKVAALIEQVAARPEFAVRDVIVAGGSVDLQAKVRRILDLQPGTSSLKLDVEELRLRVEALGPVERATVQFDPQGIMRVAVVERIAVVLFRDAHKDLVMLDKGGVEIGPAGPRADYPELPVIIGEGAPQRVGEVIELLAAAPEILPRLRALVRVGERRWDIVLDHDLLIKLPEIGSIEALSRIMALHYGEELLDRDIAVIDMRLPDRPALRMMPEAAETYQIRRAVAALDGEDT